MPPPAPPLSALAAPAERRLLVVTGKGGTGKTTVAAALATAAARAGRAATLVESQGRRDALPVLAQIAGGGPRPAHLSLATRETLRLVLRTHLPPGAGTILLAGGGLEALVGAAPDLTELLTIGRVWELTRVPSPAAGPPPLVVLDAPASGHGLALLGAARAYARTARAGPVHEQAAAIDAALHDARRTALVLVTLAERLAVNETIELHGRLREDLGLGVAAVVVNALLPVRCSDAELDRIRAAPRSRWRSAALSAAVRARHQHTERARLRAALPGTPLIDLPFRPPGPAVTGPRDARRPARRASPPRPHARGARRA